MWDLVQEARSRLLVPTCVAFGSSLPFPMVTPCRWAQLGFLPLSCGLNRGQRKVRYSQEHSKKPRGLVVSVSSPEANQ